MNLPIQFQDLDFRFIPVTKNSKVALSCWKEKNYPYNYNIIKEHKGNVAIVLGKGNLICVDIDEAEHFYNKPIFENQKTLIVETGKGFHIYFKTNTLFNKSYYKSSIGEFRTHNCYTMIPPSIHPSGREYKVYRNLPIKWASDNELNEILSFFNNYKPVKKVCNKKSTIGGDRSSIDFGFCCTLIRDNKSKEDIFRIMDKCGSERWKGETSRYKELTYINALKSCGGMI